MRKKFFAVMCFCICIVTAVCALSGCFKRVNYLDYISERRSDIFLYEDDGVSVKIVCSQKEQPYAADGIKGELCDITEIFVTLPKSYDGVEVSIEGFNGEMNWQAVERRYYLSFSAKPFKSDSADVTLTYGGESTTFAALSVKYDGVISCDEAVKYVIEHDRKLFEGLTENRLFLGEIYVRLLYDEGCYYYVGVCDKSKHVTAYLIDGEHGKVIATKDIQG